MEVYIVGDDGPEHNILHSVHKTYKGALKAWNKIRLHLLGRAKSYLKDYKSDEMWQSIVNNLSCEDPKKMNNPFHDTPYIRKYDVKN